VATDDPTRRLQDILDNVDRIRTYVKGMDATAFANSSIAQDAVQRCLTRISEAAAKLGDYMDDRYPAIHWLSLRRLGNVFRHSYDEVDEELVWAMVEVELEPLRQACEAELRRPPMSAP
jgi:uncharacterized protein with HEPN domain